MGRLKCETPVPRTYNVECPRTPARGAQASHHHPRGACRRNFWSGIFDPRDIGATINQIPVLVSWIQVKYDYFENPVLIFIYRLRLNFSAKNVTFDHLNENPVLIFETTFFSQKFDFASLLII